MSKVTLWTSGALGGEALMSLLGGEWRIAMVLAGVSAMLLFTQGETHAQ